MKREIKFRAWDKSDNLMKRVISVREDSVEVPLPRFPFVECIYDYELMQYTGLKDNNGVEIYEGDILTNGDENILYTVEWYDCGFMGKQNGTFGSRLGLSYHQRWLQVIGNIYENPELL